MPGDFPPENGGPEKPPFNKEEFIRKSSDIFIGMCVKREAVLQEAMKAADIDVPVSEIEEYSEPENIEKAIEELKENKAEWFLSRVNIIMGDACEALFMEGEEMNGNFRNKILKVDSDEIGEILDTLNKNYVNAMDLLQDWFSIDSINKLRLVAMWFKYIKKEDPLPIIRKQIIEEIINIYLTNHQDPPKKIVLMAGKKRVQEMKGEFETFEREMEEYSMGYFNDRKQGDSGFGEQLRAIGVDERFIAKIEKERKAKERDFISQNERKLAKSKFDLIQQLNEFLKNIVDPRDLASIVLGTSDTEFGRSLQNK